MHLQKWSFSNRMRGFFANAGYPLGQSTHQQADGAADQAFVRQSPGEYPAILWRLGGTPSRLSLSCAERHRMRGILTPHWEDTTIQMPPSLRVVPARHHGTEFSMDCALLAWDQHPYSCAFSTLLLAKTIPATPTPKSARFDGSGTLATVTSSNGVGSLRNTS